MSTLSINQKITGVSVSQAAPAANDGQWHNLDENPLDKRIERRPDSCLPSETNKIALSTQAGRHHVYLTVSYVPVEGRLDGEAITIERPLEFFIPAGQIAGEHQWIAATMRSLSLAARGGFIAKALTDLRKVTWTQGPVRCGTTLSGKPRFHDSEVAAIAWCIQHMLHQRGFLDENGQAYPLAELVRRYRSRQQIGVQTVIADAGQAPVAEAPKLAVIGECPNADCRGDMLLIDNCPTCISCGYSKCG